ncbi:regulatory protein RecX [Marinobacterium zhoushanense]|uniref:Regulatory protein RecX n=1 Tax=Marinobacterium zhoushanense TaxID=1679163 RepID=A0ABQ1KUJ6_9GAMM|nr:regulatory protein RecX [Marinobacterium zhoushanense]GGC07909.1 regulatory protein RecX [Marinobacterium zhoushanense]
MFNGKPSAKKLEDEAALVAAVIQLLARREYSRGELIGRLAPRVDDGEMLQAVLDRMETEGYQSDSRFAMSQARQRSAQGYGERRIRYDLQQKGVSAVLIDSTLSELAIDWYELARCQAVRKYGESIADDAKERARRSRYLLGRGFGYDEIRYALESENS